MNAAIAWIAIGAGASPFQNIVELRFEGDFQIVDADAALGGIENVADREARTDRGEKLLMSAGGHVGGV